jgi:ribosomal protein S18 acetylase RimI-like enzyme
VTEAPIRPFAPADTDACYDICLRTGDLGGGAAYLYSDPRILGEIYVGPYIERWPECAFVVEDELGVAGYIVGTPDTVEHERWQEAQWWPALRERYPVGSFPEGSADEKCVAHIHHPPTTDPAITADYPAHLHIDLLARTQGRGYGRQLMYRFFDAAAAAGAPAVHLEVSPRNTGAVAFYQRLDFTALDSGSMWGRPTTRSTDGG